MKNHETTSKIINLLLKSENNSHHQSYDELLKLLLNFYEQIISIRVRSTRTTIIHETNIDLMKLIDDINLEYFLILDKNLQKIENNPKIKNKENTREIIINQMKNRLDITEKLIKDIHQHLNSLI